MTLFKKHEEKEPHPYIAELKSLYRKEEISRRDFLRNSTLLGLSAAAAYSFAGSIFPSTAMASSIRRGGTWKCAMNIKRIDHPSRMAWKNGGNLVMQICDFLTETGNDNVTRPALLEKWNTSEDLKTWDLYLKKGIKFNNSDELTADDVVFTMGEWLNPDVGSTMLSSMSYLGGPQNVEKVDNYHVRLHLTRPNIAVPEHLNEISAAILHRNFEGDILKQPVGTGPFVLAEYVEGTRAVLEARTDHWRIGADGKPLPYLDKLIFISMDKDAGFAALQAGQIDNLYRPRTSDVAAARRMPQLKLSTIPNASCFLTRMRVDQPPWDDNRVRTALKMCQDRIKICQLAAYGEGTISIDAHVAPIFPDYCEKAIPQYDPMGAKKLLEEYAAEKGIELPLQVTLSSKNDRAEPAIAQAFQQLAKPAGFDIKIDLMPSGKYWEVWTEVNLGISDWGHRSLSIACLRLAYTKSALGKWNETHWVDEEFEDLLEKAEMTIDIKERQKIMCKIEDIMQERGPVAIPYFGYEHDLSRVGFENTQPHPSGLYIYARLIWKNG